VRCACLYCTLAQSCLGTTSRVEREKVPSRRDQLRCAWLVGDRGKGPTQLAGLSLAPLTAARHGCPVCSPEACQAGRPCPRYCCACLQAVRLPPLHPMVARSLTLTNTGTRHAAQLVRCGRPLMPKHSSADPLLPSRPLPAHRSLVAVRHRLIASPTRDSTPRRPQCGSLLGCDCLSSAVVMMNMGGPATVRAASGLPPRASLSSAPRADLLLPLAGP